MRGYRLFKGMLRRYRLWVVGVTASIFLVDVVGLAPPWIIGSAVDYLKTGLAKIPILAQFALLIVGIELIRACLRFTWRRIAWDFSRRVELDLRNELFAKAVRLPPAYFDRTTIGDLMSRATSDVEQVRMFFGMGILALMDTATIVVTTLPILIYLNPRLTLYTAIPLPLLAILCQRIFAETHRRSMRVQEQFGDLTARVLENLNGIRVVKAFAREKEETARFDEMSRDSVDLNMRLARMQAIYFPVFTVFFEMGALLVLWIGGSDVVRAKLSIGDYLRYMLYLGWVTGPMVFLGWALSVYQRGVASMERLNEILHVPEPHGGGGEEASPAGIEFRHLTFRYSDDRPEALHDVSFSVGAGTRVAIVGRTGCGKTTLVQLLARLYEPPEGAVFLGGRDVRSLSTASIRRLIGFVPQDGFLFSDTIAENISFGLEKADRARVEGASRMACLDEAVATFVDGYEQIVGERGVTLSGGQRQRACIARAIATEAPILVLDDAFSSIDAATEERVLAGIREAGKGKTVLVISHRLSSIADADSIVVLDHGRVVAQGTHQELLARGGLYADLWRRQQLEESLE
ncbi:MAG: ABC transporter ATP-binding protein [Planctomycetota bacterium]